VITAETAPEISIAVAIGDHNFPDLAEFALKPPTCKSRPTLADLMNPAPGTMGVADAQAEDVPMLDVTPLEIGGYTGDHGDVCSEGEMPADEQAEADHGEDSLMDVDDVDGHLPAPAVRKGIFSYFGSGTPKTTPQPFNAKPGKRRRNPESDLDESVDAKKPKKANGTGTSKSAASAQKTWDARKAGDLTVETADVMRYTRWQETLRTGKNGNGVNADPKVVFHPTDVKKALHSECGNWVTMGEAYKCGKWNVHIKSACPKLHPGKRPKMGVGLTGVPTLASMGWGRKKAETKKKPSRPAVPCPGITASTCPRLRRVSEAPRWIWRWSSFCDGDRACDVQEGVPPAYRQAKGHRCRRLAERVEVDHGSR
jgi:hypothetical protein